MGFEFVRPWAWALLPVCLAAVWWIDRRAGSRRAGRKRTIARAVRFALLLLLVGALSGPQVLLAGDEAITWVLADLSASARDQRGAIDGALSTGLSAAPESLQVGAIAFGQDAMVDLPPAAGREAISLGTAPDAAGTDIGGALSMASALLPEDTAGRILLLSDGQDNGGGVRAQLPGLIARGIAVDVYPIEGGDARDAQITEISPPAQVYQGEKFSVVVRVDSSYDTEATLVLLSGQQPVDTRDVTLRRGENTFVFTDIASQSGVVTYEAQLMAAGDERPQNDRLGAYIDVRGIPSVLIIGDGAELSPMLKAAGMQTITLLPGQLPETAEALRQYHAVALVNVNADDLSDAAIQALDDYVRKLGRGLCVFGGDDSYAIGGYRGSKLEDLLPVTMDVDNRLQMPSLALALVIDKSGSMTEGSFGVTRLDMAKEAALRSTEVLTARDSVGVIAFDDQAKWVVPMQQVTDLPAIQDLIGTIRPGGGTAFYSPLAHALNALAHSEAQLKHVIFLTDGDAADSGYDALVQQMAENDITLTSVAVGSGANAQVLSRLAEIGGGRFYSATDIDDIPKVFTKETYLATQSFVQNRTFYPVVRAQGPLTDYAAFPPLDGYLTTTARPLSTVALSTDREEPLLAWWQYGAGRVLAWTSDTRGAWTADVLKWRDASAFFGGMIAHVLPAESGEGELSVARSGGQTRLSYTVEDGGADLTTTAHVLAPDGGGQTVDLFASAPGVYEGVIETPLQGAYTVRIEQTDEGALARTLETGVTVGYSAEHDLRAGDGGQLLEEIAAATGGRVLSDPAELFTQQGAQARARRDISTPLLLAALCLFVLDVAQRRLAWERWLPAPKKKERTPEPATATPQPPVQTPADTPPERTPPRQPSETVDKLLERRKKKL